MTDFNYATLSLADLRGAEFAYDASFGMTIWNDTVCPDGTNSNDDDNDGNTCLNNLYLVSIP